MTRVTVAAWAVDEQQRAPNYTPTYTLTETTHFIEVHLFCFLNHLYGGLMYG